MMESVLQVHPGTIMRVREDQDCGTLCADHEWSSGRCAPQAAAAAARSAPHAPRHAAPAPSPATARPACAAQACGCSTTCASGHCTGHRGGEQQEEEEEEDGLLLDCDAIGGGPLGTFGEDAGAGMEVEEDGTVFGGDGGSDSEETFSELSDPGGTEVVFVREGVAVWPSRSERILGRLSLVKQCHVLFLAWLPYSRGTLQPDGTFKVTAAAAAAGPAGAAAAAAAPAGPGVVRGAGAQRGAGGKGELARQQPQAQQDCTLYAVHPIPLSEVKALRRSTAAAHHPPGGPPGRGGGLGRLALPALGLGGLRGETCLLVVLGNGLTLPPLHFTKGGFKALIGTLKQHVLLLKSADDSNTYLVNDTADPLCRSLTALQLSEVLMGGPPARSSATFEPGAGVVAARSTTTATTATAAPPAAAPTQHAPQLHQHPAATAAAATAPGSGSGQARGGSGSPAPCCAAMSCGPLAGGHRALSTWASPTVGLGLAAGLGLGLAGLGLGTAGAEGGAAAAAGVSGAGGGGAAAPGGVPGCAGGVGEGGGGGEGGGMRHAVSWCWAEPGVGPGSGEAFEYVAGASGSSSNGGSGCGSSYCVAGGPTREGNGGGSSFPDARQGAGAEGAGQQGGGGWAAGAGEAQEQGRRAGGLEQPWRGVSGTIVDAINRFVQNVRGTASSWIGAFDDLEEHFYHQYERDQRAEEQRRRGEAEGGGEGGGDSEGEKVEREGEAQQGAAEAGWRPQQQQGREGARRSGGAGAGAAAAPAGWAARDGGGGLGSGSNRAWAAGGSSSGAPTAAAPRVPAAACAAAGTAALARFGGAPGAAAGAGQGGGGGPATAATDVGEFELVEEGCGGEALRGVHGRRQRAPPLSREEWAAMFDTEGRLVAEAAFRDRVAASGCEPELRPEVWKHLLGLYPRGSTAAQRAEVAKGWQPEYEALRAQWQRLRPAQEAHNARWRDRRSRVDKDVRRTDRTHPMFAKEGCSALLALRNVLLTYLVYNDDLGYCQGMSDFAAPLLVVLRSEAEAFWAFAALMERFGGNFDPDQAAMTEQLAALRRLVQLLDPPLYAYLERRDCLNFYFAFRWLLVHFKREFRYNEVLQLWEACWACRRTRHLHVYLAVAVLVHHRRLILESDLDFDGLLKLCISLGPSPGERERHAGSRQGAGGGGGAGGGEEVEEGGHRDRGGKLELQPLLELAEVLVGYAGEAGREATAGLA